MKVIGVVALWVLRVLMAAAVAFAGGLKLAGAAVMVELFDLIGAGQWLRYVVGTLEVAGAVGLLIPVLSGLAATGLGALLAGAAVTNAFVINESPAVPLVYVVLCAVIAWFQRSTIASAVARVRPRAAARQ